MNTIYLTEEEIQERINEIDKEAKEIEEYKANNPLTLSDVENISDNYQYRLEQGYYLSELQAERNHLIQLRNQFHY